MRFSRMNDTTPYLKGHCQVISQQAFHLNKSSLKFCSAHCSLNTFGWMIEAPFPPHKGTLKGFGSLCNYFNRTYLGRFSISLLSEHSLIKPSMWVLWCADMFADKRVALDCSLSDLFSTRLPNPHIKAECVLF